MHNAILLTVVASLLLGQTPPVSPPAFEAASLRPANPPIGLIGLFTYPGGRIRVRQYTLEMLIEDAFNIRSFQIQGGPAWMSENRYDIDAVPPASSISSKSNPPYAKAPPNDEQREMLQSLLADRFQLKTHRETRQGPIYLLLRTSRKLNLQAPKDTNGFPWAGILNEGLAGENISMPVFATRLSGYLRRPVIDQTGLKGSFDFKCDYPPEGPDADMLSLILTSVTEIGLKLEAAKGPVEMIVIDHAERPSVN